MSIPTPMKAPYQPPENGFRTFLIIWVSQTVSVFGNELSYFAIIVWLSTVLYPAAEQQAQLAFALSAMGIVRVVTHILTTPFAGAWADRHDRKRTMMMCDVLNGLLSVALVVLMLNGLLQLGLLLVMISLSTIVGGFHGSSFDTSYAMLVPEKQLPRANGMMQTSWSLSTVVAPAVAAGLISLPSLARQGTIPGGAGAWLARLAEGTPLAIGVDALTFFAAAITLLFLAVPSPVHSAAPRAEKQKSTLAADIREGALYIWRRRPMLWLMVTFTAANLFFSFMSTLRPLMVKFNLAPDWAAGGFTYETALALVSTAIGIGGVVGGLIISAWGGLKTRRVYGVIAFAILAAGAQVAFGLSATLYLAAVASALWSGIIPFMNAHSQTIWQAQTPHELQGRVFAVRRVIAQCSYPIGAAIAGAVGGIFNPGWVVAFTGGLLALFCLSQLANPSLLRIEDKAYLDGLADQASSPAQAGTAE